MPKTIAIIGGSGFIGTELCKRLSTRTNLEFKIIDLVKSNSYPQYSSICDIQDTPRLTDLLAGVDSVINLAAEHKDNVSPVSRYYNVNVNGQKSLCAAMEKNNIQKLIFTSSVAVYGFVTNETDENGKINPFNDYGKSKYEAELIARDKKYKLNQLSIIRPTVVFGIGNRGNVYNLLRQIATGRFLMIGGGANKKSMAYVENIAAFIEYLVDKGEGVQTFNYVDKPDFTMNELVLIIQTAMNKKTKSSPSLPYWLGYTFGLICDIFTKVTKKELPISSIRIKKFCSTTQFKSSTIVSTSFQAPVPLNSALTKTIQTEFL